MHRDERTASTRYGIAENTGEGGMSDAQRGAASQLVFQMLGGRLGCNIHDMNRADGLEIYISQGAKPGLGGQLMAKKAAPELARIRGIPHGIDLRSPSRHPAVADAPDCPESAVAGFCPGSTKGLTQPFVCVVN